MSVRQYGIEDDDEDDGCYGITQTLPAMPPPLPLPWKLQWYP